MRVLFVCFFLFYRSFSRPLAFLHDDTAENGNTTWQASLRPIEVSQGLAFTEMYKETFPVEQEIQSRHTHVQRRTQFQGRGGQGEGKGQRGLKQSRKCE